MGFLYCPRCGDQSYEMLKSHDHCFNCNYSSDFEKAADLPIPPWAQKAVDDPKGGLGKLILAAEKAAEKNSPTTEPTNNLTPVGLSADVA